MHGCARGPPPEGRWGGRSNPPLLIKNKHENRVVRLGSYILLSIKTISLTVANITC